MKYNARIDYQKEVIQLDIKEGLFSVKEFQIPPKSQMWVVVKLRDKHKDVFTGATVRPNSRHSDGAVLPGSQLVKIAHGATRVLCRNLGRTEVSIPAGTKLGLAYVAEPTARQPMTAGSVNESYRNYRRTDFEYQQALNRLDLSDSVLNVGQIKQIRDVIWCERDVMSVNEEIGNLKGYFHEIKLADNTPFSGRPYRLSPPARNVMRNELLHHQEQGVIKPYMSCYNSPCLLVKKPAYKHLDISKAKVRLVVDLRALNQRVVTEKYCLPHVTESVTQIDRESLQYMTLIDLTKGFSQISLSPNSYKYVSFRTDGLGSWTLTRLPQGYKNAAEVFQRCMEDIMPVHLKKHLIIYVDDILLCTRTFEEHKRLLGELLNVLSRNGLTVQIEKSKICQKEIEFLGYVLSRDGVKIKSDKLKAILRMPRPNTVTKVRSFLGSVGYNRRFIKNFAALARPLHKLTAKDSPFAWTSECQESFDRIKQALTTAPVLSPIDYGRKLTLICDASEDGVGATLTQLSEDAKHRHVISYYSRVLNKHEMAYSSTERECLAIISAIRNYSTFLRFVKFEVVTDHRPLQYIFKSDHRAQATGRLLRWSVYLAAYEFTIRFTAGDSLEMRQTDWLSRDSFEPATVQEKQAAKEMSLQERLAQEYECPDCEPLDEIPAVLGVCTEQVVHEMTQPPLDPAVVVSISIVPTLKSDSGHELSQNKELMVNPVDDAVGTEAKPDKVTVQKTGHMKKINNYFLDYKKIYKKIENYNLRNYPEEKLKSEQDKDEFAQQIKTYLLTGQMPKALADARKILVHSDQYIVKNGVLYHIEILFGTPAEENYRVQLYVPSSMRALLMLERHEELHMSTEQLVQQVRMKYYWPQMYGIAQRIVDNCAICQADRQLRKKYEPPIKLSKVPNGPAQVWMLDHQGPIKIENKKGLRTFRYILVAVDCYSHYVELIAVPRADAPTTARAFIDRIIGNHSFPIAIRHDSGAAFTSKIMECLTQALHVRRYIGSSMHANTQGLVERKIRTINSALWRIVHTRKGHWFDQLSALQLALNATPTRSIGIAPFQLQHGRMPRDPVDLALQRLTRAPKPHREYLLELVGNLKTWRAAAFRTRRKYRDEMKKIQAKRVNVPKELNVGDFVYLACPYIGTKYHGIRRLAIGSRGPFVITDIRDNRLCRLARVSDLVELPRWIALSRLKLTYFGLDPPKFDYDPHLSAETYADWIPDEGSVNQPWDSDMEPPGLPDNNDNQNNNDNNPQTGSENESDNNDDHDNNDLEGQPVPDNDVPRPPLNPNKNAGTANDDNFTPNNHGLGEQPNTHDDDDTIIGNDKEMELPQSDEDSNRDSHEAAPDVRGDTADADSSRPSISGQWQVTARLPPKIRTTRLGAQRQDAICKPVVKILDHKFDKPTGEWYKILCQGDSHLQAVWVHRNSLFGPHVQQMIDYSKSKLRRKPKKIKDAMIQCVRKLMI